MIRSYIEINGIVQGVGFRPFIHRLVKEYGLNGWVKNTSTGVEMEVEGDEKNLTSFIKDIKLKSPKLSEIEKIKYSFDKNLKNYKGFNIIKSTDFSEKFTLISPDVCICDDCLRELFDSNNRRYQFPFINCTNCGPRFTIIKDIPYDRKKTTMEAFPMCEECIDEYHNIDDRRYHAQPDCCFECGPKVFFMDEKGREIDNPIETAKKYLKEGRILAVKGLGGIHLACDAKNNSAINRLRVRKHRDEKPFAVMCKDLETVEKLCITSKEEREVLSNYRRPIVLLEKKYDALNMLSSDNNYIGVMLPYTPLHYLLQDDELDTLVMTSANLSDLPIIYKNDDALKELKEVADGFLLNNRDIHRRCDDSLIRIFEGREYLIRRSRGYVPFPIKIENEVEEILACGAEQKASFALTKKNYVFLSQHIGDLKNIETLSNYKGQIEDFKGIFGIKPQKIVCDMHPDYMSTEYAIEVSKSYNIPLCYVQHHHAHMASCMADNNISGKVIGVIWDGTGYGTDGTIWGGEFLIGDFSSFKRVGSIKPIPLPGGDKAIKEIYRVGYSLLKEAQGEIPEEMRVSSNYLEISKMIDAAFNCPYASSMGRLFDGIAAMLKIKDIASYEGQGAIILENISVETKEIYNYNIIQENGKYVFDWRTMVKEILSDINGQVKMGIISSKFMNTIVNMAEEMLCKIRETNGINDVVLSGGVFQNIYILRELKKKLICKKFNVYYHNRVSTNDEGISLGQAMIASNGGGYYVSGNTIKN